MVKLACRHRRVNPFVICMTGKAGMGAQPFMKQDFLGISGILTDPGQFMTGNALAVWDAAEVVVTGFTFFIDISMTCAQIARIGHGIGKTDHQPDDGYKNSQYI